MEQRVSLITLGSADLGRTRAFYEALGWSVTDSNDKILVFDLIAQTLGFYELESMREEVGMELSTAASGFVLSHNVPEKSGVAPVLESAESAGGRIVKPARDMFWGGHSGHFADPDGHLWEVSWNPFSKLGPAGEFRWAGY